MNYSTTTAQTSDEAWTQALPGELRTLLADELAAGNRVKFVAGTGPDPRTSVIIVLAEPFRRPHDPLPSGVSFHEHEHDWWTSEYRTDDATGVLAAAPQN